MGIQKIRYRGKINLLVYGSPGVGKTRLVGTEPSSLILRPPTDHTVSIVDSGADEWVISGWAEMDEAFQYLRHEAAKNYKWVWLDSISLWQDVGLDDIWDTVVAAKPHRAEYGMDKGEYGRNMERLGRWVRDVVSIPGFHFGITAHPAEVMDHETGEIMLGPWVQGKGMSHKISGYMNVVGLLRQDGSKRVLLTELTEDHYAKDQYNAFNGKVVNPAIPTMTTAIEAAMKKWADEKARSPRRRRTRRAKEQ